MKLIQHLLVLAAMVGAGPVTLAQVQDLQETSVRGLPGIYVFADKLPEALQSSGVLDVELESDVEIQLKKAGIRILDRPEALALRGKPFLHVQIVGAKLPDQPVYSFLVIAALVQRVVLERDPSATGFARTWMGSNFNASGERELKPQIKASVAHVADQFIKAYRSANPKP